MPKPAHYQGSYHVDSARLRAAAYANPNTRCWRCTRTLDEIRRLKPKAKWTAGHLIDGQPGGTLRPECSPCNYAAGQRLAQARIAQRTHPTNTSATW